ncbi:conserved hypothetical protein. Putative prophage protein [Tenacibaculum dicentrarchi]|nr:conserved hypothetical protein. Putative prophage protein [Tenacibaculum dicentrarchi]
MSDKKNTVETIVKIDTKNAEKNLDNVSKSTDNLTKVNKDTAKSFNKLNEAREKVSKGFKALAKNPITLSLTALAGIFKVLQGSVNRSSKASETFSKIGLKLSGVFNGFLAVLEPVVEFIGDKFLTALNSPKQALKDLGAFIKENLINRLKSVTVFGETLTLLMQGKFKEAMKKGADAVTQLALGVENATDKITDFGKTAKKRFKEVAKATFDLSGAEKQLVKNRIALEKQQLKSLNDAEKLRQIRDDETKTIEQRIEANTKLGITLDEQLKKELAIANQTLSFARAKQVANGQTVQSIEEIGDAEIKLLEIQERITGQRSEQLVNEVTLLKDKKKLIDEQKAKDNAQLEIDKEKQAEDLANQQQAQNELDELEIQKKRDKGEKTLSLELELLEKKRLQDRTVKGLSAKEIELIDKQASYQKSKLNDAETKTEKQKNKAILKSNIDGAAEAFGVSQELAVARMIMSAPEAIGNVWTQAAKQPTLPQVILHGAVGTATTVAPIVQGLSTIKSTRFSKSKGGSKGGNIKTSASGGGGGFMPKNTSTDLVSDVSANNASRIGVDSKIGLDAEMRASARVQGSQGNEVVFSEGKYNEFQNQISFKEEKTTIS